jgi:drug/metabolite transporter (DMT)-like permease
VVAILGGVGAALCWGTSTFCSSRSTRMIGSPAVLGWVMLVGFLLVLPIALVRGIPTDIGAGDGFWLFVASTGAVGGLGIGYTALKRGKLSVVAPITATEGAIAAVLAIAFGQRLAVASLVALAVIACGVALAAIGNDAVAGDSSHRSIALAVIASGLFGVSLYASGRTGASLGWSTIILGARSLGVIVIVIPLIARHELKLTRSALPMVVTSGLLEVTGFAAFIGGVGSGDVAIPAVLSSLFAVVSAVLGFAFLGERLRSVQLAGVVTVMVGVLVLSGLQA